MTDNKFFSLEEIETVTHSDIFTEASRITFSIGEVDGHQFPIYKKEIDHANLLDVIVGSTGYQGGDSSAGCRTFLQITDRGSTDIRIKEVIRNGECIGVQLVFGGDSELETLIRALDFASTILKDQVDWKKAYPKEGEDPYL